MRMLFLESPDKRTGKTDGARAGPHSVPPNHVQSHPRQPEEYADASADNESILGETEKDDTTKSLHPEVVQQRPVYPGHYGADREQQR